MLRSLKKKKKEKIRISISKKTLKNNNQKYWKSVKSVRKNNFNTTSVVDGHIGNKNIANHFRNKFQTLFKNVPSSTYSIATLQYMIVLIVMLIMYVIRVSKKIQAIVTLLVKMMLKKLLQSLNLTKLMNVVLFCQIILFMVLICYIFIYRYYSAECYVMGMLPHHFYNHL